MKRKKEITFSQMAFDFLKENVGKERANKVIEKIRTQKKLDQEQIKFAIDLESDKTNLH